MYQLESLANLIEEAGVASLGTDMFLYHSPANVEVCVILYPSNDPPVIDPDTPNYFKAKVQMIVRTNTYDDGFEKCRALESVLTFFDKDTTDMFIKVSRPLYQPRVYRRSESGTLEFSSWYELRYIAK